MVLCVMLYVAPVAKLIRAAVGKLEVVGAGGCRAEEEVDVAVGMIAVEVGREVKVGCVGLARGVEACRV